MQNVVPANPVAEGRLSRGNRGIKPESTSIPDGFVNNRFAAKAVIITATRTIITLSRTLYKSGEVNIMTIAVPEKTNGHIIVLIPVNDCAAVAAPKLLPNSKLMVIRYEEIPTINASHLPYLSETTVRSERFDTIPNRDAITVNIAIEITASTKIHSNRYP